MRSSTDSQRNMPSERYVKLKKSFELVVNSVNIHGCSYLANRNLHISEKIVWLMLIQLAIFGTIYACLNQYNRYYIRPTVMSVEKDFRTWDGKLPAGTLCFKTNLDVEKAEAFADNIMQRGNYTDFDRTSFIDFVTTALNATAEEFEGIVDFSGEQYFESFDIYNIIMQFRLRMEDKIKISTHDPKVMVKLEPVMLEKGLCYTFNTAIVNVLGKRNYNGPRMRKSASCRYGKQECFWKIELNGIATSIDIHSPYEYSDIGSTIVSTDGDEEIFATFKVQETVAADSLRDLSPNQRRCLYPDEEDPFFGKSICLMKCRSRMALDMCNCVPHFYPFFDAPKCTPSGYECLLDFQWPGWSGTECNCGRSCIELQYPVVQVSKRLWNTNKNLSLSLTSAITIELVPPKVRNRISVVFSFEDMLVSFGGAASLFLGFSFWAALQSIFYWINYLIVYLLEEGRRRQRIAVVV